MLARIIGCCTLVMSGVASMASAAPFVYQESTDSQSKLSSVSGRYFGKTVPSKPEILGKGVLSTSAAELNCAFTPDGSELYFSIRKDGRYVLMMMKREKEQWGQRSVAPFSGTYSDVDPFLTQDGSRLYFSSNRPSEPGGQARDSNIWYVEKLDSGDWSQPSCSGIPNTPGKDDFYTSVAQDGSMYTSIFESDGNANIYCARFKNGSYQAFEPVKEVNSGYQDHDPYVAADESFLIFTSERVGGYGRKDLYISFRHDDDGWGEPINMGPLINTSGDEWCPMLSPDGSCFFYTHNTDIHWVDASVLQDMRAD